MRRRPVASRAPAAPFALAAAPLALAALLAPGGAVAADFELRSESYDIAAPSESVAREKQKELEWSAGLFRDLFAAAPPRGRVTFSSGGPGAGGGSPPGGMNGGGEGGESASPVWTLPWFTGALPGVPAGMASQMKALTHEAAHMQLVHLVNDSCVPALKSKFNGYGSYLPDWIDESVAVWHEPEGQKKERRTQMKAALAKRIPLARLFTMDHPIYMLRAPLSLAKMTYDAASGTVIYRSKMHPGLKRNFQVMAGAEWLELLCKHIPDRYEQLVRYCGWYSSRSRGARAVKVAAPGTISSGITEVLSEFAQRAKAAWARLIRKVYEADPLQCAKCKGPMRVIALIEDPAVVRAILTHLGRWQPKAVERAPPVAPGAWPAHASLPLTYHPVTDIA